MKNLRMSVLGWVVMGILAISFTFAAPMSSFGQDAASFYKGKVLTFIIPYSPGGGYDAYGRMIAPLIEKKTGATVVISNIEGGETYVAQNKVYNGKPDGLTILMLDGMVATLNQLSKDPKAKGIDLLKYELIARLSYEQGAIVLSVKSPYKTIDDMKKATRRVKFGGTKGSAVSIIGCSFLEITGVNGEIIQGFGGSSGEALAAMRGELDVFGNSASSAVKFAEQPELKVLCVVSDERSPLMPNVPMIGELIKLNAAQEKWVDRLQTILGMGRVIVTTPGAPKERVQFLQKTMGEILTDKDLLKTADKLKRPIDYLSGEDAKKNMGRLLLLPENDIKEINNVFMGKYLVR
jgi:tripartite-type tricarboxylate transporter receptor subunit TctC